MNSNYNAPQPLLRWLIFFNAIFLSVPAFAAGETATVQEILDGNQLYIDGNRLA